MSACNSLISSRENSITGHSLRNEKLRPHFRELVENDRIILGCMSPTKEIDVPKLRNLCKRQFELVDEFRKEGYQILMPPSVHETYQHTTQKIEENGGHGLGKFSEESLESMHKLTKHFREHLTRKGSHETIYRDLLRRLTFRSDPIISSFEEKTNRCGICSDYGHNRRTCQIKLTGLDAKFVGYLKRGVEEDIEEDVQEEDEEEAAEHQGFEFHDVDVNDVNDLE